jgi:hypothetical protein
MGCFPLMRHGTHRKRKDLKIYTGKLTDRRIKNKVIKQQNLCRHRDSNPALLEYKSECLPLDPTAEQKKEENNNINVNLHKVNVGYYFSCHRPKSYYYYYYYYYY